ncbi:MAG: DUF3179 domain-containing protein [Saprospirales bacterium]|jgi:hypothetical protein|nr:DUF3179 domain-containing protein [Saprospirales bacterium]
MKDWKHLVPLCGMLMWLHCRPADDPPLQAPGGGPQTRVRLIADRLNGRDILVVGESRLAFYTAFLAPGPTDAGFRAVQDSLPVVLADAAGNAYDIWGRVVAGPARGGRLEPANAMMAYWFAWGASYPGCALHQFPAVNAPPEPPGESGWLIPYSRLSRGAFPGAIPSIDAPVYLERETDFMPYLTDETLCLAVLLGDKVFVFPHPVLEWHEVVNDEQAGVPFAVLYCPLTGSGCTWRRDSFSFEVSGLLYNSNLIAWERTSDSYWSQLRHEAVGGSLAGQKAVSLQTLEMPLGTVRRLFRYFQLLSDQTPYDWEYGNFPCGNYCTDHDLILYNLFFDDPRLPRKERTFGVIVDGQAKVYRQTAFE